MDFTLGSPFEGNSTVSCLTMDHNARQGSCSVGHHSRRRSVFKTLGLAVGAAAGSTAAVTACIEMPMSSEGHGAFAGAEECIMNMDTETEEPLSRLNISKADLPEEVVSDEHLEQVSEMLSQIFRAERQDEQLDLWHQLEELEEIERQAMLLKSRRKQQQKPVKELRKMFEKEPANTVRIPPRVKPLWEKKDGFWTKKEKVDASSSTTSPDEAQRVERLELSNEVTHVERQLNSLRIDSRTPNQVKSLREQGVSLSSSLEPLHSLPVESTLVTATTHRVPVSKSVIAQTTLSTE